MKQLPTYKIRGKLYFRNERLREYKEVKNFENTIPIGDVSLSDLQTPTLADANKNYG